MILTLDDKRRLSVPASLAPTKPGDHFQAEFDAEEDTLVFRRVARKGNWFEILKACPADMADLPSRSRKLPKRRKL